LYIWNKIVVSYLVLQIACHVNQSQPIHSCCTLWFVCLDPLIKIIIYLHQTCLSNITEQSVDDWEAIEAWPVVLGEQKC